MTRTRHQKGCLKQVMRKGGSRVWIFRWRETESDGSRRARKIVVGSVRDLRNESPRGPRLGEPSSSFHIYMTQRQPGMLSASALRLIQPGIRWRSFVRHYWLRRRFGNPATARRTWWMALLA